MNRRNFLLALVAITSTPGLSFVRPVPEWLKAILATPPVVLPPWRSARQIIKRFEFGRQTGALLAVQDPRDGQWWVQAIRAQSSNYKDADLTRLLRIWAEEKARSIGLKVRTA